MLSRKQLKDNVYMTMAYTAAQLSPCRSRQVGCIILDDRHRVISVGYNGPPRYMKHCSTCERKEIRKDLDLCRATHAEINALVNCYSLRDARKMFVTTAPCYECAKVIANTEIHHIVYDCEYEERTIELFRILDIKIEKIANFSFINFE